MFQRMMVSFLCFISFSSLALAANDPDIKEVQKAYYSWCKSIGKAKGNPAIVVKHYAPEALLIPTLSSDFLINVNGGLNAYFKKLTSLKDIQCTPQTLRTFEHDHYATNSGIYRFSYVENGKTKIIPARFTFIYKNVKGHWLITDHHSSKMP